jgi:hypothetical protein
MQMLSSHEDALKFIREFESSSREYLLAKGTSEHDLASAYLELQWKFLRMIINEQPSLSHRRRVKSLRRKSHSIA